jgi:hypothetical protein
MQLLKPRALRPGSARGHGSPETAKQVDGSIRARRGQTRNAQVIEHALASAPLQASGRYL